MDRSLFTQREINLRISGWIKQYAERKARVDTLVIGISGGIDSALVSTLCAMTGLRTILVSMPIFQPVSHLKRAHDHISWLKENFLNVESVEIDLSNSFFSLGEDFAETMYASKIEVDKNQYNLAGANTRSRLRMISLYHIATVTRGIVVGTGNKVEDFGVGFYTKYGDGGVDISPIADFTKTEVKNLATDLSIIDSILIAPPSDGLWEGDRTDEDQIGATYPELEWAMQWVEEHPFEEEGDMKNFTERELKVMEIYNNFHRKNLHKMQPIPIFKL